MAMQHINEPSEQMMGINGTNYMKRSCSSSRMEQGNPGEAGKRTLQFHFVSRVKLNMHAISSCFCIERTCVYV
jgi:hypothetical protein